MNDLPVLGASMRSSKLPGCMEWLVAEQRDLEITDPCLEGGLDDDWRGAAMGVQSLLEESGYQGRVGIHGAYDGVDLATSDTVLRAAMSNRLQQSLEFGQVFGASHMVLHSPFVWFGHPLVHYAPGEERQWVIDATHAIIEPLLPLAEQMGCTLVFECCYDLNPEPLLELIRSFDSDHVRLSIDVGHAYIMQGLGGPSPDQWIRQGGDLLAHLHLQDNDGLADWHWSIGRGTVRWPAIFDALAALDHRPRLILEIEDLEGSSAWLAAQGLAQ